MRHGRLLLLYFQTVAEQRARAFVYFLLSLFSPLLMILFWKGVQTNSSSWTMGTVVSYYLLSVIASSLLMAHVENDVGVLDIQEGGLSSYILKPYSYYWLRFYSEFPWRVMQAFFGLIVFILFVFLFHVPFSIKTSPINLLETLVISLFAYFISFTYKMILGLVAFWSTDSKGIFDFSEMLIFLFSGYIVPLYLYPSILGVIAHLLPFSLMIYYPIVSLQGALSFQDTLAVMALQIFWLIILALSYLLLWKNGIKKFTGVGQ